VRCQDHHDLPPLLRTEGSQAEACFATSSSRVRRPTRRSSSATRAASWPLRSSPAKREGMRSSKVFFHRATRSGLRPCWRQRSAWVRAPVRTARTTSALNGGVKVRRVLFGIRKHSERDQYSLSYWSSFRGALHPINNYLGTEVILAAYHDININTPI